MNINSIGASINGAIQSGGAASGRASDRIERQGEQGAGPRPSKGARGGDGEMLNAVTQTLSQLGLGTISPKAAPPVTSTQAANSNNDTQSGEAGGSKSVGQAFHGFMHALFQALGSNGAKGPSPGSEQAPPADAGGEADSGTVNGGPPPGPPPGAQAGPPPTDKRYGDLVSRLQSLIQSLSTDSSASSAPTSSTGSDNTSALSSAFNTLTKALQGGTSSSTDSSSGGTSDGTSGTTTSRGTDLQTFLKTLVQNLQSAGSASLASAGNVINTSA